jgi:hypothetical protein
MGQAGIGAGCRRHPGDPGPGDGAARQLSQARAQHVSAQYVSAEHEDHAGAGPAHPAADGARIEHAAPDRAADGIPRPDADASALSHRPGGHRPRDWIAVRASVTSGAEGRS